QNDFLHFQVLQQNIECRGEETGVLGLEHEIIISFRFKAFDDWFAGYAVLKTVFNLSMEVRSPATEIVVDVDGRDAIALCSLLQGGNPLRHGDGVPEQLARLGKVQSIDHVD